MPDKLRNPWKIIFNSSKALQQLYPQLPKICWGHSTSCFIYNFVIQVISEKKLCSEGFTSNLRDIVLHENNCNYHSYRFSYKFSFILFLFSYKPNMNQVFSKLLVWYQEIFLFFVYSELRSTSKPCRILWSYIKEFSYMLFLFVLLFHGHTFNNLNGYW